MPRGGGGDAITAAARTVFAERGYHGASIRDIAARAGLSLATLYYWHGSKQELLVALLRESRQDYLRACQEALAAAPGDPASRLGAVVTATVEYRVRRRVESEISAREWRHLDPENVAALDGFRIEAAAMWTAVVEDGVRAGVFDCAHPGEARRAIQAACNAVAQWYHPAGAIGVAELARRHVEIALRIVDHRDPADDGTS